MKGSRSSGNQRQDDMDRVNGLYAEVHRVVEESRRLRQQADSLREATMGLWEAKYALVDALQTIKLVLERPGHRLTAAERVIRMIIQDVDKNLAA